jgi:hypothetical protein
MKEFFIVTSVLLMLEPQAFEYNNFILQYFVGVPHKKVKVQAATAITS